MLDVPAHVGIQWPSRQAAIACPRGNIKLTFCHECGFVFNAVFEDQTLEYDVSYDNTLHFSPHYRDYAQSVATGLIERYDLRDKDIIDIGCGRGDFLRLICELGHNRGIGFDLSHEDTRQSGKQGDPITFIQDFYSEKYADYPVDLIVSQYVLEHIPDPREFLAMVHRSVAGRDETVVYFEVPAVGLILDQLSIWDIIYEHCSYFGPGSLSRLFEETGFNVQLVRESYNGQFIQLEAYPGKLRSHQVARDQEQSKAPTTQDLANSINVFSQHFQEKVSEWQERCLQYSTDQRRVVLWGAGAKGVSFLNTPGLASAVSGVVDINPRKAGKFMAGSGHEIVSPEHLESTLPDIVILMNPVYRDEVVKQLRGLNIYAKVVDV
jgi:SAM-dependent methyltransferase